MLSLLANSITKKRCHFIGGIVELCCQCIDAGCAYIQSHVMADINNRTSYSFVNIYIRGHSTVTVFLKLDPGMGLKMLSIMSSVFVVKATIGEEL